MRGSAEVMEGKGESDIIVCPGLLTNIISIVNLFVEIWIVTHLLFLRMIFFPSILMAAERALTFLQHDSSPLPQLIGPAMDSSSSIFWES